MYAHTGTTLYTVDSDSFDLDEIGTFDAPDGDAMNDLAITPRGEIYGIGATALYTIDGSTAHATLVAEVGGEHNVGMTFLPDGSLLAADKAGGVRRIDPETGEVEELGAYGHGYGTAGDLVAVADGTMYTIADRGREHDGAAEDILLRIDPETGESIERVGPIGHQSVFGTAYANGRVYAFTRGGEIVEIDPDTGEGSLVRVHEDVDFFGAGVSPLVEPE
jgi:streptogramin lyase